MRAAGAYLPVVEWSDLKATLWAWIVLPLTALDWWIAWGHLPERVVMRYGQRGQPVAWATREQAMSFDLELLAGILAVATVVTLFAAFFQPERATRVSVGTAVCSGFIFLVVNGVLWFVQVG
jgi:hypothetical protein